MSGHINMRERERDSSIVSHCGKGENVGLRALESREMMEKINLMYIPNGRKRFGCACKVSKNRCPGPVANDLAVFPLLSSAHLVLTSK